MSETTMNVKGAGQDLAHCIVHKCTMTHWEHLAVEASEGAFVLLFLAALLVMAIVIKKVFSK